MPPPEISMLARKDLHQVGAFLQGDSGQILSIQHCQTMLTCLRCGEALPGTETDLSGVGRVLLVNLSQIIQTHNLTGLLTTINLES